MSDLTKSSKKLVREVYTYTFDQSSVTSISAGSNAVVTNDIYNLYEKDVMVGRIQYSSSGRQYASENVIYDNVQCVLFLNNNKDILNTNFGIITTLNTSAIDNTEIVTKANYATGKYQGKDVKVRIKILKNSKREVIITYKE
jgi:hypothetical protein